MNMRNMGVATRLGLGFGVVSLLLMAIIALALSSMSQIQQRLDDITKVNDVETKLAAAMDLTVTERALALRNLILLKEAKEIQIEVDRLAAQAKKYAAAQDKLGQMFAMPGTSAEERTCWSRSAGRASWPCPSSTRRPRWRWSRSRTRRISCCATSSVPCKRRGGICCAS